VLLRRRSPESVRAPSWAGKPEKVRLVERVGEFGKAGAVGEVGEVGEVGDPGGEGAPADGPEVSFRRLPCWLARLMVPGRDAVLARMVARRENAALCDPCGEKLLP